MDTQYLVGGDGPELLAVAARPRNPDGIDLLRTSQTKGEPQLRLTTVTPSRTNETGLLNSVCTDGHPCTDAVSVALLSFQLNRKPSVSVPSVVAKESSRAAACSD
jgi:hypothetical protein